MRDCDNTLAILLQQNLIQSGPIPNAPPNHILTVQLPGLALDYNSILFASDNIVTYRMYALQYIQGLISLR